MILVCVDFSDLTESVIDVASSLARRTDDELLLVHVAAEEPELVGYDRDPIGAFTPDDRAKVLAAEHRQLSEMAERLRASGLRAEPLLVMGPTVDTVVAQADRTDAQWIVVGRHGKGALASLLLGSTSEGLLRAASCPVVVVPPHAGDHGSDGSP
ncbi:MAG: universal stress protein [Acidimicrobiia bacterium]|nr:universal stress protein [Acidimicrobiia bacterium]